MILLVTGSRDWDNQPKLEFVLDALHDRYQIHLLIHGACGGADLMAEEWAKSREIAYNGRPAQWKKYGKRAGMIRNREMSMHSPAPDMVVAFHMDLNESKGTKGMVELATDKELPVLLVAQEFRWMSDLRPPSGPDNHPEK